MGEDWQEVPSRNHRRSNADDVSKVAKSAFVTNFPESVLARDLWRSCSVYGTVVDVFIPSKKSKVDWCGFDCSSGCKRKHDLNCSNGDGFLKYEHMKLPDNSTVWGALNTRECENNCAKSCNCMAYTNLNMYGNGSICVVWFDDLIDLRVIHRGGNDLYIRMSHIEIGWKKRFLFLDRRAIPDAMVWRHYDSDVNDPFPKDSFNASDVSMLTEQVVDLRPVPSGLLFMGWLATTWEFLGFHPVFKDIKGNVVTMSEYLRFPFMFGASISKGPPLTSQDQIVQHTTSPLPLGQNILAKTDHQKRVEVEDPKIVATQEQKARVAAKKREKRWQGGDGGESSRLATKRKKTATRKDGPVAFEATPSPKPLRTLKPTGPSGGVAETAEPRKDRSPRVSPHGLANRSVHNYSDTHVNEGAGTLRLGTFGDPSGKAMTIVNTEVVQSSPSHQSAHYSNLEGGESSRRGSFYVLDWSIHQRCRLDTLAWCRELMVHLAPPATQEESNALNNVTALERAWFSLARGAQAQTDILERFEHLQGEFDKLAETHAECEETVRKLVQARLDLAHSSHLYTTLSERHKAVKNEHEGCAWKLEVLRSQNDELSQANRDQALQIRKLEDELARKDSALVYAERLNAKRAKEKEKLVTQLSKTEMEKLDCIRKLLPTVMEHLLQSHEYKQSLSEPLNLAIQVR
nr:transposase (putative), gypsy type [Tanacetum cinerariifolium]